LCAKCHETRKDPFLHGPYGHRQCLICHNPHTGPYRAQTRAATATLCLGCHMTNQPDVSVNAQARTVSLLDGEPYDLASWESAPKIDELHSQSTMGILRPLIQTPGKPTAELNCLSCHDPHAGKSKHLLRESLEGPKVSQNLSPRHWGGFAGLTDEAPALEGVFSGGWQ